MDNPAPIKYFEYSGEERDAILNILTSKSCFNEEHLLAITNIASYHELAPKTKHYEDCVMLDGFHELEELGKHPNADLSNLTLENYIIWTIEISANETLNKYITQPKRPKDVGVKVKQRISDLARKLLTELDELHKAGYFIENPNLGLTGLGEIANNSILILEKDEHYSNFAYGQNTNDPHRRAFLFSILDKWKYKLKIYANSLEASLLQLLWNPISSFGIQNLNLHLSKINNGEAARGILRNYDQFKKTNVEYKFAIELLDEMDGYLIDGIEDD